MRKQNKSGLTNRKIVMARQQSQNVCKDMQKKRSKDGQLVNQMLISSGCMWCENIGQGMIQVSWLSWFAQGEWLICVTVNSLCKLHIQCLKQYIV